MIMFKGKEFLTKKEFADAIEVSYNTVTSMIDRQIISPAEKHEKHEFFTQEQVDAYWNGEYIPVKKRGDIDGSTEN